jgi:Fuc2NAc and GlcNAc transferase
VAIVLIFLAVLGYFTLSGQLEIRICLALAGGGALVAAIGYWDDWHDLPAKIRLYGHFAAAIWATFWIGGIPRLELGFTTWEWGRLGYIVAIFGIVWLLNLYNFMDGIDGIAASESIFTAGTGGVLLWASGAEGLALTTLALATACSGFLFWNWPPAKIFMGDVCSGFLGYTLGVLMIVSDQKSDVSLWVWLVLLSVFIVDATVTLLRRLLRGEKVYQAHCCHAYQHAAALLDSHLQVTLGVITINLFVLLPLGLITWNWPAYVLVTTGIAVVLLTIVALHFHAGVETNKKVDTATFSAPQHSEINPISS